MESNLTNNLHEIEHKIKAIEFAIESFADFNNEEEQRCAYLKSHIELYPYLKTYIFFNITELTAILREKEQQQTG